MLLLGVEGQVGPPWSPPFAHTIPHWEFEIAENPAPGQYRYLQWAWKAPSEATNSQTLLLNIENPGPGFAFYAGGKPPEAFTAQALKVVQMVERPPRDWKVERVDLWALVQEAKAANRFQGTARIRAMSLVSRGGPAAFDQILLGRTEADLKAALPGDNSR